MASRMLAPACSQAPLGAACCCCKFCDMGGCDVRVMSCGCCLHARCCPVSRGRLLTHCPICLQPATSLQLMPMAFEEIDQARKQAALTGVSDKRGKKRKNATIARLTANGVVVDETGSIQTSNNDNGGLLGSSAASAATANNANTDTCDLRTGRWTPEETEYCDSLIRMFEEGKLPMTDGAKLNDFLANMLKSKQSRLTKKMKNARLSTRQYSLATGHIPTQEQARDFSRKETEFFASIKCPMERSEIRFHMQKEWRELFSGYCVAIGQTLDAGDWLSSVEELETRQSMQKDAARMVRRKVMMGQALNNDSLNSTQRGVYIDVPSKPEQQQQQGDYTAASVSNTFSSAPSAESRAMLLSDSLVESAGAIPAPLMLELAKTDRNPMKHYASPFIEKMLQFIQRHKIPFEHVDVWVPSFVPALGLSPNEAGAADGDEQQQQCRLCFAGCGTAETKISTSGAVVPLNREELFNLLAFGDYSQKFSFDVGCGLPGRVYSSGVASWEQGIQNAPPAQFERSGGASQWGIQTVLGVPVTSPSVGRIVVLFYSMLDRPRDLPVVNRLSEDLQKLRPSPKWKLVVDVGIAVPPRTAGTTDEELQMHFALLNLIQKCTPADKSSPLAQYLPGFTSLRILLTQQDRSARDDELLKAILSCYDSYKRVGRSEADIATMTARDFMVLSRQKSAVCNGNNNLLGQQNDGGQHQQQQLVARQQMQSAAVALAQRSQATGQASGANGGLQSYSQQPQGGVGRANGTVEVPLQQFSLGTSYGYGVQDQLPSLGASPTMQPIPSQQSESMAELAPLGLTASQLAALLQNDAQF